MAGRTPGGRMFSNTEDLICTVDDAVCDEDLDLFSRAEIYVIDDVVGRWGRYDCREIDDMMSDRDLFPELDGLLIGMEVSENAMFSAVGDLDPNGSVERLRDIRGINELFAAARAL
jgi:hypothetical protein